jgi:putative solute:sodium symporter small subunit
LSHKRSVKIKIAFALPHGATSNGSFMLAPRPSERSAVPAASGDIPSIWFRNLRLTAVLLLVWAALTFVPPYFAESLSFSIFGWPFSYWMAAYGSPLAYLLIIVAYAWSMNRADSDDAEK